MSRRRRQDYIGCSVEAHEGRLRLRYRIPGKPGHRARATGLEDTADNRRALQPLARMIGAVIRGGKDPTEVIEPNSVLPHWYACQRALGVRVRGLYSTKDTFVTTSLNAGVKIAWLEQQTGVSYGTLRRHYGKWMPTDGDAELQRFASLDPTLFDPQIVPGGDKPLGTTPKNRKNSRASGVRKGGLEPPRVFSPQDPESCASANSATFAERARKVTACRGTVNGTAPRAPHRRASCPRPAPTDMDPRCADSPSRSSP
jgi:hypothetical protein